MVWGVELWDTFNPQAYHFLKYNIDFLDSYRSFLKQRAKIEESYSKDLKKLAKDAKSKMYNKQDSSVVFSVQCVFDQMLDELTAFSNQHESIRDHLIESEKGVKTCTKELKKLKDSVEHTVVNLNKEIEKRRSQLDTCKKKYWSAFQSYKQAHEDHEKFKEDRNLPMVEVDRYKTIMEQRQQQFVESEKTYGKSLTDFNQAQTDYLTTQMPKQLDELESIERTFVSETQAFFKNWVSEEEQSLNVQQKCIEGMRTSVQQINADRDIELFLNSTQSGNPLPDNCAFEQLTLDPTRSTSETSLNQTSKKSTLFGTLRGKKGGDGPAQQKRKLNKEIQEKEKEYAKVYNELEGLRKMVNCAPNAGFNVNQIQARIASIEPLVQQLDDELRDLKSRVASLNGGSYDGGYTSNNNTAAAPSANQAPPQTLAAAFDDEFDSPTTPAPPALPPPPSAPPTAPLPAVPKLPTALVLYEFNDASQSDNLLVYENETVYIVNNETDGWTRAQKMTGEEGFVPTTYLQFN